jgi:eukaryotic-like serine/threonine-protein kinase
MVSHGADWWQAVSPYLDQALEMTAEERADLLAQLRERNPSLAGELEALLNEHETLASEGFLEEGPALPSEKLGLRGQKVGAYTLVSLIGQGGMGSVWLAERSDGRFERRVAIKFLNFALVGLGGEERFTREGSILGRLKHPSIAQLADAGMSSSGQPYLVLEHVEGKPIDQYCDAVKLDVEARTRLFLDVLAAVAHAHAHLIVHRDIKLSNVLVRIDGQVKLLDFGIAKLLEGEGKTGAPTLLTREGGMALTPEYAAPEQVTGGPVTTATDVYALGVLLYVLLTGQHPAGPGVHSPADLVKTIVDTEPPRPSDAVLKSKADFPALAALAAGRGTSPEKLGRALRGDLDTIIAKALKKNPQKRYASVTAFADDLRRYLSHEPIGARPDTFAYRAVKFVRRNRTSVALAALIIVATLVGVASILIQGEKVRAERDFALRQLSRAESINDLNNFILTDAAPSGKPFTVNELLKRAEDIVQREHADQDLNRVELLVSIGQQFEGLDEPGDARRVLEKAYRLSRGFSDRSARAQTSCALAGSLGRAGEIKRAEALFQEGLGELPDEPQYALDRVFCLMQGSDVSRNSGSSSESIARARAAERILRESPLDSELMELRSMINLAESYRQAGEYNAAIQTFEKMAGLMASLGRDSTQTAGTMFNDWALALDQLGRPLEAEKYYRRALEISRVDQSDEGVSQLLLINYARTLRELGRLDEAAATAESAYAKAKAASDEVGINQSLLERARIYREQQNPDRAEAMLAEVEPRLRRDLPPGHYAFAAVARERALLAQARGNLPAALDFMTRSLAILEASAKAGKQGGNFLPIVLTERADIEIQLRRFENAAADATQSLNLLKAIVPAGTFSCNLGRAYMGLGRALLMEGKPGAARDAFRSAAKNLEAALGPDHREARNARQLAALGPAGQ